MAAALQLSDTARLPLHAHSYQLQLPHALPATSRRMRGDRALFTLTAPLPEFFRQSLQDLGLAPQADT